MVEDRYQRYCDALQDSRSNWRISKCLGKGNSAVVFLVETDTGSFALKIYDSRFFVGQNASIERRRIQEQVGLKDHGCSSLIRIHEAGTILDSCYLLMDYVPWRSLDEVVRDLPPTAIPLLLPQLAEAAKCLEDLGFVHRDIKPSNILVSPEFTRLVLVDLGVLKSIGDPQGDITDHGNTKPFVATAQYSSPEYLFRLVEPSPDYWRALTFYQIGGVLHDLITWVPLFDEEARTANRYILAMAVYRRVPHIASGTVSPYYIRLARSCLEKDMTRRLQSVSWHHLLSPKVFDAKAERERLGLNGRPDQGDRQSARAEREMVVLLQKCRTRVGDTVVSILRSEGYPRTTLTHVKDVCQTVVIELVPELHNEGQFVLALVFKFTAVSGISGAFDILISAYLRSGNVASPQEATRVVWSSTSDDLDTDVDGPLRAELSSLLLRIYSEADLAMASMPDGDTCRKLEEWVDG